MPAPSLVPPDELPHVWRGRELARPQEPTLSTGHAQLDRHFPGGGWPLGCLVEVLQAQAERHVWQLLLPGLVGATQAHAGPVILVAPPLQPFVPALQAQGLPADKLLCVHAEKPAARLWATEQALRCAEVAAVLAWLPEARPEEMRRLHLGAQSRGHFFVAFRKPAVRHQSTAARLRLLVEGGDQLAVHILKRRGPPLLQPLWLAAEPQRLAALLAARQSRAAPVSPVRAPQPQPATSALSRAMDRIAALAP